jgi:Tfp pilus assembly protein PilN
MAVIAELQAQLQAAQNLTAQLQAESDAKDQQIATLTAENAALKSRASEVDQLAKQIDAKNPDA